MLIRYAYKDGQLFYKEQSNTIPRIGETIIFNCDELDYNNCYHEVKYFMENGKFKATKLDTYTIDSLNDEMFRVSDVCYVIGNETFVDVTVTDYDYSDHGDYLDNLAKDVNVPHDYNR